jgi:hypothetical protein
MKMELDFGDYVMIEQKRHGVENGFYKYKVIGQDGQSNTWVDVPVETPEKETMHKNMEDVVRCVCCSIDERKILQYRVSDIDISFGRLK